MTTPPGPSALQFLRGVARDGFLGFVDAQWRTHGDVFQVRIGKRTLIFALHPDAVQQVTFANRKNYDKLDTYQPMRDYLLGQGLVASTGDLWQRQRRLMAPFYTVQGVRSYAELMIRDAERLLPRWQELADRGVEVDIGEEMTLLTASIILKSMFSTDTVDEIDAIKGAVETMISFFEALMRGPRLPVLLWVPTRKNRRYVAARELVHRTIRTLLEQRRATAPSTWPDDLLSRLMKAHDPDTGQPMSDDLLRDESITTFVAGHETTARTMTFAFYALAANPDVADRFHEELDHVLGGRLPTPDDLERLPYTLRVLKEVMRLYPSIPFIGRDAVGPDRIGDHDIPAGASVMCSPFFTHRHPEFWEDPERFDPDRWTGEREAARHKYAYFPFAAGQRVCIGNNFSLLETHLLLAILGQRFSPRLRDGYRLRLEMQGTLALAGGLPMRIVAR